MAAPDSMDPLSLGESVARNIRRTITEAVAASIDAQIASPASHATQGKGDTGDRLASLAEASNASPLDAVVTGNVPPSVGSESPASESPTRPRVDPLKVTVKRRLEADGRWKDVAPVRDQMMREARAGGMTKEQAQEWVYSELDRLYPAPAASLPIVTQTDIISESPHLSPYVPTKPISDSVTDTGQIQGLNDIPEGWNQHLLPPNASMAVELAWVQANRLRLVTERPGRSTLVDLSQAISPAPSWGALGWLETSIYSKAKFVEALVKVGGGDDEGESAVMRRERKSVDEVRALLREMQAAEGTCPSCGKPF